MSETSDANGGTGTRESVPDSAAPKVRLTGVLDHFVFDTDHVLLNYEVEHPDGRVEKRSVPAYRNGMLCELDLS
jgi:hypothetical protein